MSRQRVFINGKKYYQHPVFSNYAASKNGEIVNVKTEKCKKNDKGYYQFKVCDKKTKKNLKNTFSIVLYMKQSRVLFQRNLLLTIVTIVKQITKLKIYNY